MLLGGKVFLIAGAVILLFGFGTGVLHINRDKTRCLVTRSWSVGSWHTWFAIGKLEFRVKDYTCDPEWKLDPDQWHNDHGTISPKSLTD